MTSLETTRLNPVLTLSQIFYTIIPFSFIAQNSLKKNTDYGRYVIYRDHKVNQVLTLSQIFYTIIPFFFADWCYEKNTDFSGNDIYKYPTVSTPLQCREACQSIRGCKFFSFSSNHACWLKRSDSGRTCKAGSSSGPAFCGKKFCPSYLTCTDLSTNRI